MSNLFREIEVLLADGHPVAVASIVRAHGSSPRHRGTRCGVRADGAVLGTIGGGLLEAKTQAAGREALADGRVRLLELRLDSRDLAAAGMICGGALDIAVVPWGPAQLPLARAAAAALDGPSGAALVLTWSADGATWSQDLWQHGAWLGDGLDGPNLSDLLHAAADQGQPAMRGDRTAGLVVDPLLCPRAPLLILGAGHVGRALAHVAALADFAVTVVDDRPEFADTSELPWADRVVCRPFPGTLDALGATADTSVVVCTRGHLADAECTAEALESPAPYVGVIGSRHKRALLLQHLQQSGIAAARLEALHLPVGLAIGAETPEEIAIAVVAELIQVRHGRGTAQ